MNYTLLDRVLDNINSLYDQDREMVVPTRKTRIFIELINDLANFYKVDKSEYKEIKNPQDKVPYIFQGNTPDLDNLLENARVIHYADHKENGRFRNMESKFLVFNENYDNSIQITLFELNFTARGQKPSMARVYSFVLKEYLMEDLLDYMDTIDENDGVKRQYDGRFYYFENNKVDVISDRDIVAYVSIYDDRIKDELHNVLDSALTILSDAENKIKDDPSNTEKYLLELRNILNRKLGDK